MDNSEQDERKEFDIFAVTRIIDRAYAQFDGDVEKTQEVVQKRLASMGCPIDLEETRRQHECRDFHPTAEIIAVADDGMRFIRYNGCWVVGTDSTQYLCFRVKADCIEVLRPDGVAIINA